MPAERTHRPPGPGSVGLVLPTFAQQETPPWAAERPPTGAALDSVTAMCADAEAAGADALWTCDHLFWHGPSLESLLVLTVAATATSRAWLGSCVVQLPLRQAPAVAKQAATLQILADGRFVLGVGVGSHEGEYLRSGIDFRARGRLLDDGIDELRRAWDSGRGVARGDTGEGAAPGARYLQLPVPAPVPVWVGGSSEAALRRAATAGDGWMPLFLDPTEYGGALDRLVKEVARAGRHADDVTPAIVLFVSIDDDPGVARRRGTGWMSSLYGIPAKAFERHLVSGSADDVAGVVRAFRTLGARHVALYVTADRPIDQFQRLQGALSAPGATTRT